MDIIFYNNSQEKNRVSKTLGTSLEVEGYLREGCSVTAPSILIDKSYSANIFSFNYAYIPDFKRYYFIDDITTESNNLWRLNMSVDVLMSFSTGIKSITTIVDRNANDYNDLLEDKNINYKYNKEIKTYNLLPLEVFDSTDLSYSNINYVVSHYVSQKALDLDIEIKPTRYVITHYPTDYTFTLPNSPCADLFTNINANGFGDIRDNLVTSIIPTYGDMQTLVRYVARSSSKADFVSSVYAYPFAVAKYDSTDKIHLYLDESKVQVGDPLTEETIVADCYATQTLGSNRIVLGTYYFEWSNENYLDFEPYTTYDIYIPFVGLVNVPSEMIYDRYLTIIYDVDYSDGSATYLLVSSSTASANRNNTIVSSGNCQIGVPIPLTTTNAETIRNTIISGMLNSAVNGIGVMFGVGGLSQALGMRNQPKQGGFTAKKKRAVVSATTDLLNTTLNEFSDFNSFVSRGNSSVQTGLEGAFSPLDVYLQVTKTVPTIDIDNETYRTLYGKPLREVRTLGNLTGFTTCENFHLEGLGFNTATSTELDEIDSLLRGGVIL